MTNILPPSKLNFVIHGNLTENEAILHEHSVGQLLYAEKGVLHIEYADKKILLPAQYCSWIPPFSVHRLWSSSSDIFIRGIYFESHFCKNKVFSTSAVFPLSNVLKEMIRYTAKWHNHTENSDYENTFIKCVRQMLPDEIAAAVKLEIPVTGHPLLSRILNYIAENIQNEIRIQGIGELFGISGKTLHRLFVKELGLSFSIYLMFFRVMKAIELLNEGNHSVKEVTYLVGYNSIPSFSSIFKQVTGANPQSFIKK
ncbi:AraC family transcriptional regulator [Pedobacter cryoconitis]|uniref:AraC-like DNA-binding protein n=1 Tax=Pedobacter cryoconitis TaxID=188932 RepID=A0A7X0J0Y5_9SPHI|nr:AraC family transcriptional regulator [Pedobacter cryoconitis]MBB6499079.1 AraC-like DNA-binding protein [Pedobacter cryoconitis]